MVRFYFSPPSLPILQRFKLNCIGIVLPVLQIVNVDCATCCTDKKKVPFLIFFSSRTGTYVAVDHPHTPGFQCIGRTLRTDAKLTSQIPLLSLIFDVYLYLLS